MDLSTYHVLYNYVHQFYSGVNNIKHLVLGMVTSPCLQI